MDISYKHSSIAVKTYRDTLKRLVLKPSVNRVCDVGGGANPEARHRPTLFQDVGYDILDISSEQLDRAPDIYNKVIKDISSPSYAPDAEYDLVFSKFVAEHIKDGYHFHNNVYNSLSPGGFAIHLFPTLYSPPFLFNKIIPDNISRFILYKGWPRDPKYHDKFPAFYNWCFGPTNKQIYRLKKIGYDICTYIGFFGIPYIGKIIPFFKKIDSWMSDYLVKKPIPQLTSYACVTLRKPS